MLHELGDGVRSVSDALLEHGGNEGDGLCLVEGETPGESLLSKSACLEGGQCSCTRGNETKNGPGEGGVYLVPVGQSSWFEIEPGIRLLSPSPSHDDPI